MQEVFTISGAPDFDFGAAAKKNLAVVKLQSALRALGQAVGDGMLAKIGVDGKLGPATVAATNRALTTHVGPGQATESVRTGKLTVNGVNFKIAYITSVIAAEVGRRGGSVAPPPKPRTSTVRRPSVSTTTPEAEPPTEGGGFRAFLTKPAVIGGIGIALGLIATGLGVSVMLEKGGGSASAPAMAGFGFGASAFTKKHFITIADILCTHGAPRELTASFARHFKSDNPAFDENRFIKAATTCPAYRHAA